jgi:pSer/pThr/pTyr-binding forkhead associated (FHA) protein/Mg-chelatase subunit ChlD
VLYADLSNPYVRTDVVMARFSNDAHTFAAEPVPQMAQRYADRYPGLQVVAGINASYFGPNSHGPQGLVKATTRQGGTSSGSFTTLFSPYLNSQSYDGVDVKSSLGISPDGQLMIDHDFYEQHAGFIGGGSGDGRALTAGPRIISNGGILPEDQFVQNCYRESYPTSYCTAARPRAAAGVIDQQGLVLVVGQNDLLRNTALLLQEHGVETAMKLDDGSSAQLWYVDDPFIPSRGGGSVVNALLVYSRPLAEQEASPGSDTVFLIDVSGSMEEETEGRQKIAWAQSAANSVINMIEHESSISGANNRVAVASFSEGAWLNLELSDDYDRARQIVSNLTPQQRTDMGAGLRVTLQALRSSAADQKIVILLSDGLTNEGLTPSEILSGPVSQIVSEGACIFTIGFGEPQDLNGDLLQTIADTSGCGMYSRTNAPQELLRTYVHAHLASEGTVIGTYEGQVQQGETQTAGQANVERGQAQLYVAETGAGSDLDLIVTDPRGRRVDYDYPHASWMESNQLDYLIVQNPVPGDWLFEVYGADVPEGILDYSVIAAVQERESTGLLPVGRGGILAVVILAVVVAAGVGLVAAQPSVGARRQVGLQILGGAHPSFVPLRRKPLTIGRHPRNAVVLNDPQVSARHAVIHRTPQGYVLTDLSSKNGTFVNGDQVQQKSLRGGERLRLGETELMFVGPLGASRQGYSPTRAMAYMVVLVGDQEFDRCPVTSGTILGRNASCPIDLSADALVSRQHARLDHRDGRWTITNLSSQNTTLVNGRPVQAKTLKSGDVIQMGRTKMRFTLGL